MGNVKKCVGVWGSEGRCEKRCGSVRKCRGRCGESMWGECGGCRKVC